MAEAGTTAATSRSSVAHIGSRGAAVTLAGQGLKFLIQSAAIVVLARLLEPSDFGRFAVVSAIAGLAAVFGDFGLSFAAVQAKTLSLQERTNLFWLNLAIGIVFGLVFLVSAPLIGAFYGGLGITTIAQVMSVLFLLQALSVQHRADLSRSLRFTDLAIADVGSQGLGLIVAIGASLAGFGVWALVGQQLVAAAAITAIVWSRDRWLPRLPRRSASVVPHIRYGANTLAGTLVNYVSSNIDTASLGRFVTAVTVGVYSRMFQLFSLPLQQLAAPLTRVALPLLAPVAHEDPVRFERLLGRAQLCLCYPLLFLYAVIGSSSGSVIEIALGLRWLQGAPLLSVLCIGGVFQALGYPTYWAFLAKAKMHVQFRIGLVSRIVMVGLIVAAAPLGALAVSVAVAVGLFTNWLAYLLLGFPRMQLRARTIVLPSMRPAVAFVVFGVVWNLAAASLRESVGPVVALAVGLVACAAWTTLLWLLVPAVRRDIGLLARFVRPVMARRALKAG